MSMSSYCDDPLDPKNDIEHFGVKGMKWGVRKQKRTLYKSLRSVNKNLKKAANTNNAKKREKFMARYKDAERSFASAKKSLEKSGFTVGEIMAAKVGRSGDIYAIRKAKIGKNKSEDGLQNELLKSQRRKERALNIIYFASDFLI